MHSAEFILTIDEMALYAGRFAIINDVAFAVEYSDIDDWYVDAIGFVESYNKFGGHAIQWLDDRDPLAALIRTKIKEYSDMIEERIATEQAEAA
jgi:hypothetical protein